MLLVGSNETSKILFETVNNSLNRILVNLEDWSKLDRSIVLGIAVAFGF